MQTWKFVKLLPPVNPPEDSDNQILPPTPGEYRYELQIYGKIVFQSVSHITNFQANFTWGRDFMTILKLENSVHSFIG